MTDSEFLQAFLGGSLREFHHRDHLRLAWLRVREAGSAAEALVASDIKGFAARAGAARKYHETLTVFWVGLVRHADRAYRPASFDDLLDRCPLLLDQGAAGRHWSHDLLKSEAARAGWVEPDLLAMPAG